MDVENQKLEIVSDRKAEEDVPTFRAMEVVLLLSVVFKYFGGIHITTNLIAHIFSQLKEKFNKRGRKDVEHYELWIATWIGLWENRIELSEFVKEDMDYFSSFLGYRYFAHLFSPTSDARIQISITKSYSANFKGDCFHDRTLKNPLKCYLKTHKGRSMLK